MEIYIVRVYLESSKNPLEAGDINVFSELEEAKKYIIELCEKNKLKVKNNNNSDNNFCNNRYYMYEDFLEEHFIWIEKHNI
jgi:hypothetical protein